MNASRVDHPRTRPVALRTKTARSAESPAPVAIVAMLAPPPLVATDRPALVLAAGQHEVLHLLLAVEIDDDPEQLSLLIGAPRVDAQRPSQPVRPACLVDVSVQR